MSDIFISYASADRPRVKLLVEALRQRGWSVWWDRTIPPGKTWDQIIEAALEKARCVIVLWSMHSVRSDWVLTEAEEAKQRGVLFPALLDDVKIPLAFRRIHAANLVDWSVASPNVEFDELVRAVSEVLNDSPPPATHAQERTNPKDGLVYIWIPPGKFSMGCSPGDDESPDTEKPPHEVTITRGFWMGKTPVTVAAYNRFRKSAAKNPNLPAVDVSWEEAKAYCEWTGLRLPTEAEWEYAARAGTTSARYGELDDIAWHAGNSGGKLHPVGEKRPNAWGLHDMLGNVWEWVSDWYGGEYYKQKEGLDPAGPPAGRHRVVRGGSWGGSAGYVRASYRFSYEPSRRYSFIGFRCVGEFR